MATLAKMIDERRDNKPYDDLAREIGMKTPTLFRYITGERNISIPNMRMIAAWARERNDWELINALASYALGFDQIDISSG